MFSFVKKFWNGKKRLWEMDSKELRRNELILDREQRHLISRMDQKGKEKQAIFERGSAEKVQEVRMTLAQQFELLTTEQMMLGRQLNLRAKERITVARLRIMKENAERSKQFGRSSNSMINSSDIVKMTSMIENDSIRSDIYQQKLDEILRVGVAADEASSGTSEAGKAVMEVWSKMDYGVIDPLAAFAEADRQVRNKQLTTEGV